MEFRPYQIKAYNICLEYFKSNNPVPSIAVLPTAWGKSFLIAQLAKTLQKWVLILQPSIELLDQNYNKFILTGEQASVYSASKKTREIGNVTYATLGSIISAKNIADKFSYIIIDECH